ncbi:hypothetical protein M7775_23400 [Sporomusa sphaeroides DSM 2875]|uniref:hypothetical protein n=1 Tax=Sporomusa sphaeroides TaxID=47679 RepID=UPI00202FF870|nr:hypothetical protein [Sporomusa sphaeroides]MCM0761501.1 hypothetical protein [Sporomusa sphaeroides DSM 2875]
MIKTVYGPPPTDAERIEAAEPEVENCIREEEATTPLAKTSRRKKGEGTDESGKC